MPKETSASAPPPRTAPPPKSGTQMRPPPPIPRSPPAFGHPPAPTPKSVLIGSVAEETKSDSPRLRRRPDIKTATKKDIQRTSADFAAQAEANAKERRDARMKEVRESEVSDEDFATGAEEESKDL